MADRLKADVDALEAFAGRLDAARSQFDATTKAASTAGSGLANARLASALADFDQRWRAHRDVMDSYFAALSRMVGDSAKALRQRDVELAAIHTDAVASRQVSS